MFDVHIVVTNGSHNTVVDFRAVDIQTIGPVGDRQLHFLKALPDGKREMYAVYVNRIKAMTLEAV